MRRDHRPYWIKKLLSRGNRWYVERFVRPHFDSLGKHPRVLQARSIEVHGKNIHAGAYLHAISTHKQPIRLTTWSSRQSQGKIDIGSFCLISPGVEITAADHISIGDNVMIAAECVLSDSDWHGLYNRIRPFRCTAPIQLADNVWLGHRVTILKGVHIGENTVIGAGSVVTRDLPANCVAAGNPAKIVKHINPKRRMLKRAFLFQKGDYYWDQQEKIDAFLHTENTLLGWLKSVLKPNSND